MFKITTHTMVANEENFIWYSLVSVEDSVSKMLVFDDHSTDKTLNIVKSIRVPKIEITEVYSHSAEEYTALRNKMVSATSTDWFMVLDGDEVWNRLTLENFLKFVIKQPKDIYAVALRTRNCVGDVYHYLPEGAGNYQLLGRKGHLNIRAYRKLPGFHWAGGYPFEYYADNNGKPINNQEKHMAYFEGYYWHLTHLQRSSSPDKVKGFRRQPKEIGIPVNPKDFPEVFSLQAPQGIPNPLSNRRSFLFGIEASILTPLRVLKRKVR